MPYTSELLHFLQQGGVLLDQVVTEAAQQWELTCTEARILLFLAAVPGLDTARDVAKKCGMSKASVSGNVLKLSARGLLRVDLDRRDRRFQHLTLTGEAQPIAESIRRRIHQLADQMLHPLSQAERTQLAALLTRLHQN